MHIVGVLFENFKAFFLMKDDSEEVTRQPIEDFYYSYEEQAFFGKLELLHEDRKHETPSTEDENETGEHVGFDSLEDAEELANNSDQGSDLEDFVDRRSEADLTVHETSMDLALEDADKEIRKQRRKVREEKLRQKIEVQVRAELEQQYRDQLDYYKERERHRGTLKIESDDEME